MRCACTSASTNPKGVTVGELDDPIQPGADAGPTGAGMSRRKLLLAGLSGVAATTAVGGLAVSGLTS
ncbi:MAG: hypothetical protein QOD37_1563, partial [Gaiellales bacterium]|nr:hypothetical protein [Gaiellales bacterium]